MKDHDLLTIKKFSDYTGIKQSTLRHYDEIGLFKPTLRTENGYRYYSAQQTISVNLIIVLTNAGITVKTIKDFIEHRTPEQIFTLLQGQIPELNRELSRIQHAYSIIHTYSEMIKEGIHADIKKISVRLMPKTFIELGPINDFSSGYLYNSYFYFLHRMEERNINAAYPAGGYYNDIESFTKKPGQPDRYFSHIPIGSDVKEAGEYLVGYTKGFYGQIGDLPNRMNKYIKHNNLIITGPVYEMYLFDEVTVDNPDQYLIQISTPVKKLR